MRFLGHIGPFDLAHLPGDVAQFDHPIRFACDEAHLGIAVLQFDQRGLESLGDYFVRIEHGFDEIVAAELRAGGSEIWPFLLGLGIDGMAGDATLRGEKTRTIRDTALAGHRGFHHIWNRQVRDFFATMHGT